MTVYYARKIGGHLTITPSIFNIFQKFKLILNGDIEELQRVSLSTIYKRWSNLYEQFGKFRDRGDLYKIIGNHDWELMILKNTIDLLNGIKEIEQNMNIRNLFLKLLILEI